MEEEVEGEKGKEEGEKGGGQEKNNEERKAEILNRMLLHTFHWLLICSKAISRFLLDSSDT